MKRIPRKKSTYQILYFVSHLLFIGYSYILGRGYFWGGLLLGLCVFNLAAGLYQHRAISHNHFHFSSPVQTGLGILFSMCNFGSIAVNSAIHINHHRYVDTEADPHDFKQIGYLRTVLKNWQDKHLPNRRLILKFLKEPDLKLQHNNHMKYAIVAAICFPFIPVVAFWSINLLFIVSHWGKDESSSAINIPWLLPLMWGDEMHRDHHDYPGRKKMHQLDGLYYVGCFLEGFGHEVYGKKTLLKP